MCNEELEAGHRCQRKDAMGTRTISGVKMREVECYFDLRLYDALVDVAKNNHTTLQELVRSLVLEALKRLAAEERAEKRKEIERRTTLTPIESDD